MECVYKFGEQTPHRPFQKTNPARCGASCQKDLGEEGEVLDAQPAARGPVCTAQLSIVPPGPLRSNHSRSHAARTRTRFMAIPTRWRRLLEPRLELEPFSWSMLGDSRAGQPEATVSVLPRVELDAARRWQRSTQDFNQTPPRPASPHLTPLRPTPH